MQTDEPASHQELPLIVAACFSLRIIRVTSPSPFGAPFETRSLFLAPLTNEFFPSLPDGPRTVLDIRPAALTIQRLYFPLGHLSSPWHSQGSTII